MKLSTTWLNSNTRPIEVLERIVDCIWVLGPAVGGEAEKRGSEQHEHQITPQSGEGASRSRPRKAPGRALPHFGRQSSSFAAASTSSASRPVNS